MTTSIGPSRRAASDAAHGARRREWWRSALTARVALAGAFFAILLGVVYASGDSARTVASCAGFATAITLIAAAVISWEHVVADAQTDGLVEPSDPVPSA